MHRMPIPLAPLAEQRRIVAKIEELFSDLDAGVAALERVRANLKRYRAAVLEAAVRGRLTGAEGGMFDAANWQPLEVAIEGLEQGWSPKCERASSLDPSEWVVMTTTAIQAMHFDGNENKRLPSSLNPRSDLEVKPGDVLITRAGPRSRAGVACYVKTTRPKVILCDKAYRFKCKPDQAIGSYIELALNSPPITKALDEMKTGISDSGVNLTQGRFRQLLIPLPAVGVQQEIVAEVQRRTSMIDAIAIEVENGLNRADRLRQAILKRAFEGRFVPQDPSDEPANELLTRLRQDALAPVSPARKLRPGAERSSRRRRTTAPAGDLFGG